MEHASRRLSSRPRLSILSLATVLACAVLSCSSLAAQEASETPAQRTKRNTRWCYQAIERPAVPAGDAQRAIDRFVDARLAKAGLRANPPAARAALLRRLYYDLTGLPPTPTEVADFLEDARPDAYERRVDALLASKQYGVHQARRWLDLVRWAETDSYERDRGKPGAWLYRDWVVDAMNDDMPYDAFVTKQLAGDEVPKSSMRDRIATGYLHLGIRDDEPTDPLQALYDDFDGMADTTARVMLGISLGCARCHDHKKDPLPIEDYYRFVAFFENLKPYKVGGGNGIRTRNFVRTEGVDDGPEGNRAQQLAWTKRRDALLATLRARASRVQQSAERSTLRDAMRRGLAADLSDAAAAAKDSGMLVKGPAVEADEKGSYLRFDGADDWAEIENPIAGDDFTISFRFRSKHASSGAQFYRWHHGDGLIDGEIPGITQDFGTSLLAGGRVSAGCGDPEVSIVSQPGYDDGRWHTVAFTRVRKTGRIELWMDGARSAWANASKKRLDRTKRLRIGRLAGTNKFFQGSLGDIRIWKRALEPRELVSLHLGAAASPDCAARIEEQLGADAARAHAAELRAFWEHRKPAHRTRTFLCAQERGPRAPKSFVRERGNANVKGVEVTPGFPRMLGSASDVEATSFAQATRQSSGRRLALARWITDAKNPLAARVIVNRVWQQHFGRGIVRTPNDFGRLGTKPTHPQLLDWLASELVSDGWSLKRLRRKILLSAAYRRSSDAPRAALERDPQNDLFGRFAPRRLSAEELRDSILRINGSLVPKLGGPSVYPEMPREVLATSSRPNAAWGRTQAKDAARRSLYIFVKRSLLMPFLTGFDLADTDASCPVRFVTTQPTQALTMMNSEFLQREAAKFAARLEGEAKDVRAQLRRGLELVMQRRARENEVDRAVDLHAALMREEGLDASNALRKLCLLFYNINEFFYVD